MFGVATIESTAETHEGRPLGIHERMFALASSKAGGSADPPLRHARHADLQGFRMAASAREFLRGVTPRCGLQEFPQCTGLRDHTETTPGGRSDAVQDRLHALV
jgi:hypothetical protein